MYHTPRTHWQLRLINVSFVLLFLAAVGLLHWLSREYSLRLDLTEARRHSLSEASAAVLKTLTGPVRITAYASERGEVRRLIRDTVALYQRHKGDIELAFVDPDNSPEKVRAAGVTYDGELVFEYEGSRETLPPQRLTEEHFTNLLQRLGRRGERWLVFLSGHGERSPDRQANFDLSTWAKELRARGFKTREHSLAEHPQLPANTSVLIIAGPRSRLLAGELKEIDAYVRRGGNLLWLHDPGPLHGLEPLADILGIEFQAGVIVDPVSAGITNNVTAVVVTQYGGHPVVRNFAEATVFPHAAGVLAQSDEPGTARGRTKKAVDGWKAQPLLDTRPAAWSETGALTGRVEFDPGKDIRGPLNVAVALSRELPAEPAAGGAARREQRVVVSGDGDFLSNTFIANGGNLALGMNTINWLSRDDAYVNVPVRTAPDRTLALSSGAQIAIAVGFLILMPLAFAGAGAAVWWRRRKR
jgi:ABC-type uncharacterized transport system involved in gliding motility auxiliary subunit